MTKQTVVLAAIALTGFLAAPVSAEVPQPKPKPQQGQVVSKVPQKQQQLVKKRENAKKQRDQKLKIRQKNAGTAN